MTTLPDADPHLGRTLGGQYRIDALLGSGGMGRVYKGVQLSVNRPVAIKLITGSLPHPPEWVRRFQREAEATARLSHPNSVRLFDFGVTEAEELFMVMELLEGTNLARQLVEHGPMQLPDALSITRQVLLALSEAHALGIVHRDIKPDNVFLAHVHGGDLVAKVMDFGIAGLERSSFSGKLTGTGVVIGTPDYMSPEQAQGLAVDGRGDLYSLGVVLFEMLAGRPVFEADTAMQLLMAHITRPPRRLIDIGVDCPKRNAVQALLDGLLAKDPQKRPSIQAALEAIAAICDGQVASGTNITSRGSLAPRTSAKVSRQVATAVAPMVTQRRLQPSATVVRVPKNRPWWLLAVASLLVLAAAVAALAPRDAPTPAEKPQVAAAPPKTTSPVPDAGAPQLALVREPGAKVRPAHAPEREALARAAGDAPVPEPRDEPSWWASQMALAAEPPIPQEDEAAPALVPAAPPPAAPRPAEPSKPEDAPFTVILKPAAVHGISLTTTERTTASPPPKAAPLSERTSPSADRSSRSNPSSQMQEDEEEIERAERHHGAKVFVRMFARALGKLLIPDPSRERRQELANERLRYQSFRDAHAAYKGGDIDGDGFQDAVWQLRERRRRKIFVERDNLARGNISRGQYDARVDRIWEEFWGG